jgi:hypothetical protein
MLKLNRINIIDSTSNTCLSSRQPAKKVYRKLFVIGQSTIVKQIGISHDNHPPWKIIYNYDRSHAIL